MKTDFKNKLLQFDSASKFLSELQVKGKKIVHCHGTFDLLHPGHLIHIEEAASLGDILVVTFTEDKFVRKGPGRPFFNNELRSRSLASLSCVDYVIPIPFPTAVEAIECVRPSIYCKGKEYQDPKIDETGNILKDIEAVKRFGGDIVYLGSVVYSSTKLLNKHFQTYSSRTKEFCENLAEEFSPKLFTKLVNDFSKLKILVIGDVIFDKYSTVSVQGLTSKNRILSGRFTKERIQAGGALAIFRHMREFTSNIKLLSLLGEETWLDHLLKPYICPSESLLVHDNSFTTTVKQRFVEPYHEGKELNKLFSVNFIAEEHPSKKIRDRLLTKIEKHINHFDLIMVADFGHGVMMDSVRELVQERASYLALNCQTNSNNYGYNIINKQYQRADSFSLDQTELSLACGRKHFDGVEQLRILKDHFGATYGWFTRGGTETIGIKGTECPCFCDPLENKIVDTIGAGDAFSALVSMAAVKGYPIELSTFLGQLAGAIAVRIVGNTECVTKVGLVKAAKAMLKF